MGMGNGIGGRGWDRIGERRNDKVDRGVERNEK
jgi:hypothetical protein